MRVTMLSWEYPPVVVGGLGRHVDALSRRLAADGVEVDVVTRCSPGDGTRETRDKVEVMRATPDGLEIDFSTESLLAWAATQEHALLRAALPRAATHPPDVVHAHDWLVGQSAVTLAQVTGAPLVVTIHATEAGRHGGLLTTPLRRAIHSVECWLVQQADRVITCSQAMRDEVSGSLGLDPARIDVVPNAVDPANWWTPAGYRRAVRSGLAGSAPLIVVAGRLEWEKGVQTVITALPGLRRRHPGLVLAIAGEGSFASELRELASRKRVSGAVRWLGRVDDPELAGLLGAADVAIVPSLYEPFGLVALEAAAAGTARVVSDVGGLAELVRPDRTGLRVPPDAPAALAVAVSSLLDDPALRARMVSAARRDLRAHYTWGAVATATLQVYGRAR